MKSGEICDIFILFGVLAQLGACHTGSVEVTGSSPVYSINSKNELYLDCNVETRIK